MARKPTFETLLLRMFTEADFLAEFAKGGTTRERALESIGFDPRDIGKIMGELDKIDFKQIKEVIQTMPCSKVLQEALMKPEN
jgi:hypothetical protein